VKVHVIDDGADVWLTASAANDVVPGEVEPAADQTSVA
jgi:hypothetical protein